MDPGTAALLKLAISLYFQIAQANAATEADLEKLYQNEKRKFFVNNPNNLEDV